MLHLSTRKLIQKLCELTGQGDIQWHEGEAGQPVYDTEGYLVELAGEPVTFRVLRADGRELERANPADLAAEAWPDGSGTFADHVGAMSAQAGRIARGAEQAISRILSSLSAPPALAPAAEPARAEEPSYSAAGGPESEAAMAAAVADMALRLKTAPLEEPANAAPAEPAAAAPSSTEPAAPPADRPMQPVRMLSPSAADRVVRSSEMFGRTRSFAVARHPHHRPATPEARPVASLGKITATGLLLTGIHAITRQQIELEKPSAAFTEAEPVAPAAPPIDPRPAPQPASPDVYKPWA